jgi:flavin reductase (DIM6/NTAB) family NADH-FMN oxidoreductase RutF
MREIPHSVVVVTASREYASAPWQKSERPHKDFCGATISSMTSVTLGPPAIISFNLKTPSTTLDSILANKEFRIHLLTANRDGAEVANSFIKHKHEEAFDHLRAHGRSIGTGAGYQEVPPPTLHGPGIRGYLLCTVLKDKCIEVGDHMVVIARVDGIRPRDYDALPGGMGCLMYANQQYKRHGDALILHERSSPLRPAASEGNLAAIRFIGENEPELVRRLTMLLREGGGISEENRQSEKTGELSVKDGAPINDALDSVLRYVDVGRSELIRKVDFKLKARATRGEEGGDDAGNRSLEEEVVGRLVELIERSPEEWAKRAMANQEPKGKQEKGHQPWWHI